MRDSAPSLEADDVERMRRRIRRDTYSNDHFEMDLAPVGQGDAQATEAAHRRALEQSYPSLLYDLAVCCGAFADLIPIYRRPGAFIDIAPDVLP